MRPTVSRAITCGQITQAERAVFCIRSPRWDNVLRGRSERRVGRCEVFLSSRIPRRETGHHAAGSHRQGPSPPTSGTPTWNPARCSSGKDRMRGLSRWAGACGLALALADAVCPSSLGVGVPTAGALASLVVNGRPPTSARPVPRCRTGQIVVGGIGSSTAAGTVLLTLRVTDISTRACAIRGWPRLSFIGQRGAPLPVALSHEGPPSLRPGKDRRHDPFVGPDFGLRHRLRGRHEPSPALRLRVLGPRGAVRCNRLVFCCRPAGPDPVRGVRGSFPWARGRAATRRTSPP